MDLLLARTIGSQYDVERCLEPSQRNEEFIMKVAKGLQSPSDLGERRRQTKREG